MSQDTDVPTGQGFSSSAKLDCTTANGSLSASSLLYFEQLIEGQNLQYLKKGTSSAESTTLSFGLSQTKLELIFVKYLIMIIQEQFLNLIQFHLLILGKRKP
jgi:hypothetical protein